ncbi:uncharacterized protein T27F2.1-like [Phoenix dactylifera]|nr:uncharacterized protein T27F2.1-like [Phoenix dactylifera]
MLACPAPISQRPDRRPVEQRRSDPKPGSSQGAPRSPPAPPSPARLSLPGPSEVDSRSERRPYLPLWDVFEGDSALENPAVARQHLHEVETLMHIASDYRERARRCQRGQEEAERSEVRAAKARLAEDHSALAVREQEVKGAQLKVKELETREERAQEEAQHAVRLFRKSEEFRNLLEEEAVDGLIRRFEDFRNQLRRLCPEFDLNLLQPGAGVEEGDGSEDPAGAEVQATEEAEVPIEGDPEGASDAALQAAGET